MPTPLSSLLGSQFQGSQGIQGTQGFTGSQGSQGVQGVQGLSNQGVQGTQGIQGLSNQGVQGTIGIQGSSGSQGAQGIGGAQGDIGSQGAQGTQGFSPVGIPSSTNTTLVATDAGKFTIINGNVTINASTGFSPGDMCTIYNSGTVTRTITATAVTLRWAGTSTTGNRFLSQKGLGNILCVASNDYVITGAGLT